MLSILTELELRTKQNPEKLLYVFLDLNGKIKQSYTYREFDYRSRTIASHIYGNYNLKKGDRILLAYPPGLEMICSFFACVRLGLIPVPVYPPAAQGFQASLYKMNFIAKDCEATAILTDRSYYWSIKLNLTRKNITTFSYKSDYISKLKWIISDDSRSSGLSDFVESHSEALFLQYTSGSTNNPKGVIVTHQNILYNYNSVVDHLPIGVSWLPQYHDMGLIGYYIFFALKGGTTYGFSPLDFIQRPALWLETISKYAATASSAPNFAYEYCLRPGKIPEQTFEKLKLSSLKFLMTAAEPVRTDIYAAFLKKFEAYGLDPKCFFSAYGLAEFTLAVSNYGRTISSFDTRALNNNEAIEKKPEQSDLNTTSYLSCGKLLGDTEVKIVDITTIPKEVSNGKIGEIWINGSSKCKGYWNRPVLTQETFEAKIDLTSDSKTWLRSGDLGFLLNNELYVCGRLKDMIIIRGLNYYPQDIEVLVEQDSGIRKGCVAAFSVEQDGHETLVVVAELKNKKEIPDSHTINHKILQFLGISADQFVFIHSRTMPKTSSGKLMRDVTKNLLLQNELNIICKINIAAETCVKNEKGDHLKEENDLFNKPEHQPSHYRLFQRYGLDGHEVASLENTGFDSLKLAEFAHDLKSHLCDQGFEDLSQEIDLRLVQKIAISELFEILDGLNTKAPHSKFRYKRAFARLHQEYKKNEMQMMKKDAMAAVINDENIRLIEPDCSTSHILLTGGTGFFGPFLIKSLLEQNEEDIYVIVRAQNNEEGKRRLRKAFSTLETSQKLIDSFEKRIVPVCGDLSRTKLGISEEDWDFLSKNIHTIYHNGALVNYLFDYESMRDINVGGTNEVIRLAMTSQLKTLNHISTTFIFGWSVKETLFESDSNEAMELLDFGYSQSKWVSEQVVLNAMKSGLKARIFRPALISPSISGDGYNFDISIRLLAFMLKYGISTSAQNQVSFTPADIAANNIVAISHIEESMGKTFHVTRDHFSTMYDVSEILGDLTGKKFENFPLYDFVPEVVSRCTKEDLLFPLLNFLLRSIDNISAMEYKRYDNRNYRKYCDLSPWGKKDGSLNEVVLGIFRFMQSQNIVTNTKQMENV